MKKGLGFIFSGLLCLLSVPAFAQMSLSPLPIQHFVDNNGNPLSGGQLFTYQAGTTTKVLTYTDSTGATANSDPVILNSRGEAQVWIPPGQSYKFVLSPSTDSDPPTNPIWTIDQITIGAQTAAGFSLNVNCLNITLTTSITCSADQLVLAPALGSNTTILSSYSQNFAGNVVGAGGMDTGSIPVSGWLCLYAISGRAGTSILGTNCAVSSGNIYSGANMPPGYTSSAILAPLGTNSSGQILPVLVQGRHADENVMTALNSSTLQASIVPLNISCCVPQNAIKAYGNLSTLGTSLVQMVLSVYSTSIGLGRNISSSQNTFGNVENQLNVAVSTPQTIYYSTGSSTGGSYEIFITGYSW